MIDMRWAAAALFTAGAALAQEAPQPESTHGIADRTAVEAQEFMVASAHPLATQAGYDVLAAGGSAADAAVAVQMVLNVVEPQSSGIGGGAFALHWDASLGALTSFDGRETAPMAATPDIWLGEDGKPVEFWQAVVGGKSVGVPGTLLMMRELHERYGRLPWSGLFDPAIGHAADGFAVSPRLAAAIAEAAEHGLGDVAPASALFFRQDGTPLASGETLRNPDLARSFRLLAAEGPEPFYAGSIARDIVAAVRSAPNPGAMTLADLGAYAVKERPAVCMDYRGREVCGMGPPSSGALTVGQTLGILTAFDLGATGPGPEATHLFVEASKLAFADRGLFMADSDFVAMPEGLLDPGYLAARASLIAPDRAMAKAAPGEPPWKEGRLYGPDGDRPNQGTSHFVIVDADGNMLSLTTTIETGFGSRVMAGGFLLNNELTDFAFAPEADGKPVANRVEPGKRPRSSMAPTIVFEDGRPMLLIGSPGGASIIGYVAGSLVRILDFGEDPQAAIDAPHVVNRNGPTQVEEGAEAAATIEALAASGQEAEATDLNSGLHAILIRPDGTLVGAADKRREGAVLGR